MSQPFPFCSDPAVFTEDSHGSSPRDWPASSLANAEGGVRCEGTARETRAADVQERHPVFRVGARVPKCLHSYRIARAKSESGYGCAEIGDAPQHLAAHYSEFRTRHPAVTSFHPSPTAK